MAQASFTPHNEKMETFRLQSGHVIPAVGLGTWKSDSPRESVQTALIEVTFTTMCFERVSVFYINSMYVFLRYILLGSRLVIGMWIRQQNTEFK